MRWIHDVLAWLGLSVSYRVTVKSKGDVDASWAARQLNQYDKLLEIGCLEAVVWWGWARYTGEAAVSSLQVLGEEDRFFLAYANATVWDDAGEMYENPGSVPVDAQTQKIVFTGREPLPCFKDLG